MRGFAWDRRCAHRLKESDIGFSLHECTDNSTWVLSRKIKGGSELLKGRDPLYIDNLQRVGITGRVGAPSGGGGGEEIHHDESFS